MTRRRWHSFLRFSRVRLCEPSEPRSRFGLDYNVAGICSHSMSHRILRALAGVLAPLSRAARGRRDNGPSSDGAHRADEPPLVPAIATLRQAPPRREGSEAVPEIFAGASDAEILDIARSLVYVRPLIPYPEWHFDADWNDPELAFRKRRAIWEHFQGAPPHPLVIDWYRGLKLRLHLSDDMSKQIFVGGCQDPNELAFLAKTLRTGMCFVDAGADQGLYTLLAARLVGPMGTVWAFEPSERERQRLGQNVELNALGDVVRVFPFALADEDGRTDLQIAEDEHAGHNTLGAFAYDVQPLRAETVPLRTLDGVAKEHGLDRLDVLKIDVEGAECRVLRGAHGVLRRFRPFILFEVFDAALRHQGCSLEELLDLLRSHDYLLYAFDAATGQPTPAARGVFSDNMLAVPAGR